MYRYLNLLRRLLRVSLLAVLPLGLLFANAAHAATTTCTYPSSSQSSVLQFTSPVITAGSRSLNTELQVLSPGVGFFAASAANDIVQTVSVNGVPAPGFTNIYQTNLSGIGIKLRASIGVNGGFGVAPMTNTVASVNAGSSAHYVSAILVVIGPVQSGVLKSLPSMTETFSGGCSNTPSVTWTIADGTVVNAMTCAVSAGSKNLSVPLGIVKTSDFGAVGSTAGSANFSIALENCSAGVNLFATFTDGFNPGNTSNVLSLTNDGRAASGVGIRILTESGMTVGFGPDSYLPGTLNQIALGSSTTGTVILPFTAKYVKTDTTINSGAANGIATFTLSYQ